MADQAPLNDERSPPGTAHDGFHGAGTVAANLLGLAELQTQLFQAELRELRTHARWVIPAWLVAILLIAATLPVFLLALGFYLAEEYDMSTAAGLLWAALAAIVAASLVAAIGWWKFRSQAMFVRSRDELKENIHLIKDALAKHPSSSSESRDL